MWRARYSGLGPRGIDRLRQLEQENSNLRRVLDVKDLEIDVLKAELQHIQNADGGTPPNERAQN
jgi:hypothetical protein